MPSVGRWVSRAWGGRAGVGLGLRTAAACSLAALTACASSGAVPSPFPRPGPAGSRAGPLPSVDPDDVVSTALSYRGVPYRDGGADPSGFDCSGLVSYVFARHGVFVPRTVAGQFQMGQEIDASRVAPGDLVFFSTVAAGASHVGIVVSGGEFVHAPSGSGVVRVERLSAAYWAGRFVGARRLSTIRDGPSP